MNTPNVERRISPKKAIAGDTAEAVKAVAKRTPRLWVMIILGALSWVIVVAVVWLAYAYWFAPPVLPA